MQVRHFVYEIGRRKNQRRTAFVLSGYGDDVETPKIAQDDQADSEGELTAVMSRDAKNVSVVDTLDYVLVLLLPMMYPHGKAWIPGI